MVRVRVVTAKGNVDVTLDGSEVGRAIARKLPIVSTVTRWGDEIYFDVPVRMKNTAPTRDVKVGDVAYWPDGPSLCMFFGRTPASRTAGPRAGSDVTVVGHTDAPVDLLRSLKEGLALRLERAGNNRPRTVRARSNARSLR